MPRYKVLVDDNFHYMDVEARFEHGTFHTAEEAISACRNIVDTVLRDNHRPGMNQRNGAPNSAEIGIPGNGNRNSGN